MSNLHVRDVMTSEVFTVRADESIAALQEVMRKNRIRHVPVVDDDGAVLGVVSQLDVLERSFFDEDDQVTDIMAWNVKTIDADDDVATAATIMLDNQYGCLPVVEEGVLAGILTEADFVKSVARGRAVRRR
jgi:CBS domain-containing membrane protein